MIVQPSDHAVREQGLQGQNELGDVLVAYLEQLGVGYVFGIPGGAIEPLYNALARSARRGGCRPIVARHETGASFMADGYTRQTGKLGVCCATTGPGATNLITGVASAYENQIPMLVLTAQTALPNFGRGAFQESSCTGTNTIGMFQYCTRYNTLVSHVDQFERKLAAALMTAYQSPRGPAHLSIPLDVLRAPAPLESPLYNIAALVNRPSWLARDAVEELCAQIEKARKVVFVIGAGCSEAMSTILEVALMINAAIATTPQGKGLVSAYHPLFRGVIGFAGHSSAREALTDPEVDTVVAVGTNFTELASDGWDCRALLNDRLIHVESVEGHLTRSPMAKLHVWGTLVTIFEHLLNHMRKVFPQESPSHGSKTDPGRADRPKLPFRLDEEPKYYSDSTPIKPQRLMCELTALFPPNTRFLADTGSSFAWAIHYLHPFDRRVSGKRAQNAGLFGAALEFASMGWAIGAAIGTALGAPGNPVVCITGDGSLLMSGQEITVAVQERLPVIFVILNDAALGMVKHGQALAHAEPVACGLPDIDYCAFAKAMGADGYTIRSPQDLLDLDVPAICARSGPTLLDVRIDPEEVPPMKTRMRVLNAVQ